MDRVRREGAALEAVILGYKRHPDRGKPLLCSACGNIIENEFFVCVYETGLKVHVACGWFAMVSEPSGAEPTASKSQSR